MKTLNNTALALTLITVNADVLAGDRDLLFTSASVADTQVRVIESVESRKLR